MDGKSVGFDTSIVDTMEVGQLPDSAWRRLIELVIIYRKFDGAMPGINEIAWHLRITPDQLRADIRILDEAGLVTDDGVPCYGFLDDIVSFTSSHSDPGYVYLFRRPTDGAIKIGLSRRPDDRLRTIAAEFPNTKQVHLMRTNNMRATELALHEKYDGCRLDGEWFRLGDDMVKSIMAMEGVEHVN